MRTKKAPLKVIVNRKRWYRGQGDEYSALLLDNNKMCCIGFLARKLGYTPKDIRNRATLYEVSNRDEFENEYDSTLSEAYKVNDEIMITDNKRERRLITLGKRMGVQFEFIN